MSDSVDLNRLMWLGAGAGTKGIIAGMVSGIAPEAGITPEVGSLAVGFLLAQQGGARIGAFGEGMLIASIGQLVRKPIEGIFGKIGGGGTTPPANQVKETATKTNSPTDTLDAYLQNKYGIV